MKNLLHLLIKFSKGFGECLFKHFVVVRAFDQLRKICVDSNNTLLVIGLEVTRSTTELGFGYCFERLSNTLDDPTHLFSSVLSQNISVAIKETFDDVRDDFVCLNGFVPTFLNEERFNTTIPIRDLSVLTRNGHQLIRVVLTYNSYKLVGFTSTNTNDIGVPHSIQSICILSKICDITEGVTSNNGQGTLASHLDAVQTQTDWVRQKGSSSDIVIHLA